MSDLDLLPSACGHASCCRARACVVITVSTARPCTHAVADRMLPRALPRGRIRMLPRVVHLLALVATAEAVAFEDTNAYKNCAASPATCYIMRAARRAPGPRVHARPAHVSRLRPPHSVSIGELARAARPLRLLLPICRAAAQRMDNAGVTGSIPTGVGLFTALTKLYRAARVRPLPKASALAAACACSHTCMCLLMTPDVHLGHQAGDRRRAHGHLPDRARPSHSADAIVRTMRSSSHALRVKRASHPLTLTQSAPCCNWAHQQAVNASSRPSSGVSLWFAPCDRLAQGSNHGRARV